MKPEEAHSATREWIVNPSRSFKGAIRVPGDKSISHRAALLALLGDGESVIDGYLASEDCLNTLKAIKALGADVALDGSRVHVRGTGGRLHTPKADIDCGNSGTGMRLLAGLAAGSGVQCTLTGDASLRSRPMRRILEPLGAMGARITALGPDGRAPLRLAGGALTGCEQRMTIASAQLKSCLLLAGLSAAGTTVVVEPQRTRDHTERMLRAMGVPLHIDGLSVRIEGNGTTPSLPSSAWSVPGDFSSAAFWLVAAAIVPQGCVVVRDVGLNPRRTALLDVLRRMGADVSSGKPRDADWEPRADITVRAAELRSTTVAGDEIPNLIDELPVLCAAAAVAQGVTRIRDAAELRVKESDRITAMAEVLRAFRVDVTECDDGMDIHGGGVLRGGTTIESRGDHRIAMSAAVLALRADAPVRIQDVACVATSYPNFQDDLKQLTGEAA